MSATTILAALWALFATAWAVAATTVLLIERAARTELDDAPAASEPLPGNVRVIRRGGAA